MFQTMSKFCLRKCELCLIFHFLTLLASNLTSQIQFYLVAAAILQSRMLCREHWLRRFSGLDQLFSWLYQESGKSSRTSLRKLLQRSQEFSNLFQVGPRVMDIKRFCPSKREMKLHWCSISQTSLFSKESNKQLASIIVSSFSMVLPHLNRAQLTTLHR